MPGRPSLMDGLGSTHRRLRKGRVKWHRVQVKMTDTDTGRQNHQSQATGTDTQQQTNRPMTSLFAPESLNHTEIRATVATAQRQHTSQGHYS